MQMRASIGKVWGMGSSASLPPGAHPPRTLTQAPAQSSPDQGPTQRVQPVGVTHHKLHLQPAPPPGDGGGAASPRLPVLAHSFWWPAPSIWKPTRCHLIRTKDTPVNQEMPKGLGALCKTPLLAHHSGNDRASGALRQKLGSKTKY